VTVGCALSELLRQSHYFITKALIHVAQLAIYLVLPASVLVINAMLIREVRRASNYAAANLGLQQQQQQSSNVPTAMLVTTSLIYVLIHWAEYILLESHRWTSSPFLYNCVATAQALYFLVYAYNFYVYLITGKQFRSELRTLFSRCFSSSCRSAAAAAVAHDGGDAVTMRHIQAGSSV